LRQRWFDYQSGAGSGHRENYLFAVIAHSRAATGA